MDDSCLAVPMGSRSPRPKASMSSGRMSPGSPGSGRSSPESNCPICLGKLENKSFTNSCLHQFCFKCLHEWSKVKAECPLCKQRFKSIIHNVRSMGDYDEYNVNINAASSSAGLLRVILPAQEEPFRYRTTAVSSYLDYYVRLEQMVMSSHVLPAYPPRQRRPTTRSRTTSDFRRNVYQQGLWVQRESNFPESVRESSPEFYRVNPATTHRLVPWLSRELNVLCNNNAEVVQSAIERILRQITMVPIRSHAFHRAVAPFVGRHTEHFVHEFYSFATSQYDLVGYDRHVNYVNNASLAHDPITSDDSSDDDVQVVGGGHAVMPRRPARSVHLNPLMFGALPPPPPPPVNPLHAIPVFSDSDPDDCVVVDTIPPRRIAPEVITLDSSDDEPIRVVDTPQRPVPILPNLTTAKPEPQPGPSRSRRPLKRNWHIVQNLQVPSTSSNGDLSVSIKIDHSCRSASSSSSVESCSSEKARKKRSSKKKSRKDKGKKDKGKSMKRARKSKRAVSKKSKKEDVRPKRRISSSDDLSSSDDDRSTSPVVLPKKRKLSTIPPSSESDSDRLHIDTDFSSYCSDNSDDFKSQIRSVVVKSEYSDVKSEFVPPLSPAVSDISVGNVSPSRNFALTSSKFRPSSDSDSDDSWQESKYSRKKWLLKS